MNNMNMMEDMARIEVERGTDYVVWLAVKTVVGFRHGDEDGLRFRHEVVD